MKIHVLSDLHTEFGRFEIPKTDADVLVLAGDIGAKLAGLELATLQLEIPVLYVAGNHEYYGAAIPDLTEKLRDAARDSQIQFLENDVFVHQHVRFLGCTLWTDFAILGLEHRALAMWEAEQKMNDYRLIRKSPNFGRFRPQDTVSLHFASVKWLQSQLEIPFSGRTVVVTHHAPSAKSFDPKYQTDHLSAAFGSNLEALIENSRIDLWIHGHTHYCVDYVLHGTRILSNQRGYPDQLCAGFVPNLVLEARV
jgi:predicted phosphodiesterase